MSASLASTQVERLHRLPLKDKGLLANGLLRLREKNLPQTKHRPVCSEHFEPICFEDNELISQAKQKDLQLSFFWSPALCSCAASSKHANNSWGSYNLNTRACSWMFISIPVPSRSFVKSSQNPRNFSGLKTKRCIRLKLIVWREPLSILTHWRLNEIAHDPPVIPWRFFGTFRSASKHKNKPYMQ